MKNCNAGYLKNDLIFLDLVVARQNAQVVLPSKVKSGHLINNRLRIHQEVINRRFMNKGR